MADITASVSETLELSSTTSSPSMEQSVSDSVYPSASGVIDTISKNLSSSFSISTSGYRSTREVSASGVVNFVDQLTNSASATPSGHDIMNVGENGDSSTYDSKGEIQIVYLGEDTPQGHNFVVNSPSGSYMHRDRILFDARVFDYITGDPVPSGQIVWYSSIDGRIGAGHTFFQDSLSPGYHNISVAASGSPVKKVFPISILPGSKPERPENLSES